MKRVGIFTKMGMVGGSEFRAVEMAAAINQVSGCQGVLLIEKEMPEKLRAVIGPGVEVHEGIFSRPDIEALYSVDHLLIINTDSREFTTEAYWQGMSPIHAYKVDLTRIRQMVFLFNFIVSPSCSLPALKRRVPDIRIITANSKFFDEISEQDRYEAVRHYPRLQLESPINPMVALPKAEAARLRLGMHSLPSPGKWNKQFPELIKAVNDRHGERISWDFMGMHQSVQKNIQDPNVIKRPAFSLPVDEYLTGIDIFVFFLEWKREEAWARCAGEALMSGCPVITTAKGGNRNQVIHGNTGFLCKSFDDFVAACGRLIDQPELMNAMQQNAQSFARSFSSSEIARRFLDFLR